jgi:hypothetical protein
MESRGRKKEEDVPKIGFTFTEMSPMLADGPPVARAGSGEMLRELGSLGLSQEASLGILKVLIGRRPPQAVSDPSEW